DDDMDGSSVHMTTPSRMLTSDTRIDVDAQYPYDTSSIMRTVSPTFGVSPLPYRFLQSICITDLHTNPVRTPACRLHGDGPDHLAAILDQHGRCATPTLAQRRGRVPDMRLRHR